MSFPAGLTRPRQLLIVEDDQVTAELILFRLRRDGHEVNHVSDGKAALAYFDAQEPVDLAIFDVMMPYYSGYELQTLMRAHTRWSGVPVIMLTGMGREDDILQGLKLGASDYLTKPFRPAELSARVKAVLERSS
jgi:DNA-binding response OmpR family regulator